MLYSCSNLSLSTITFRLEVIHITITEGFHYYPFYLQWIAQRICTNDTIQLYEFFDDHINSTALNHLAMLILKGKLILSNASELCLFTILLQLSKLQCHWRIFLLCKRTPYSETTSREPNTEWAKQICIVIRLSFQTNNLMCKALEDTHWRIRYTISIYYIIVIL